MRSLGFAVLMCLVSSSVSADVAITWRRVTGATSAIEARVVETIAGGKQREDEFSAGGVLTFSAIRDLAAGKEYLLWHEFKLRQTETFAPRTQKPGPRETTIERRVKQAAGKPTGRVDTIAGVRCREYSFVAVAYDSKFVVNGTYWLPEQPQAADEFAAFYERFSDTQVDKEAGISKGNRAKMRGRLELRREFLAAARRNGIPYRMEYDVSGSGTAPIHVKQEVVALSTATVDPRVFDVPAGYKVR